MVQFTPHCLTLSGNIHLIFQIKSLHWSGFPHTSPKKHFYVSVWFPTSQTIGSATALRDKDIMGIGCWSHHLDHLCKRFPKERQFLLPSFPQQHFWKSPTRFSFRINQRKLPPEGFAIFTFTPAQSSSMKKNYWSSSVNCWADRHKPKDGYKSSNLSKPGNKSRW